MHAWPARLWSRVAEPGLPAGESHAPWALDGRFERADPACPSGIGVTEAPLVRLLRQARIRSGQPTGPEHVNRLRAPVPPAGRRDPHRHGRHRRRRQVDRSGKQHCVALAAELHAAVDTRDRFEGDLERPGRWRVCQQRSRCRWRGDEHQPISDVRHGPGRILGGVHGLPPVERYSPGIRVRGHTRPELGSSRPGGCRHLEGRSSHGRA